MSNLFLSWKNLTSKPLSMALSLILFALGVGLISLLFLLNKQLEDKFDSNLAGIDLVIGAKGSPLQLILASMYHIDNPTGNVAIKEIKPFLRPGHPLIDKAVPLSMGDSHKGYRIIGTTRDFLDMYGAKIGEGQLWEKDFEVNLGAGVAADLGLRVGDTFQSSHGFVMDDNLVHDDANAFKVTGILAPTGSVIDQLIITNTQSIWHTHDHTNTESAAESENHEGHDHEHSEQHDHTGHSHEGHSHEEEIIENITETPHYTVASLLAEDEEKQITSLLIKFKARNYQALNMQRSINENTDMQAATPAIEINRLYAMMGVGLDALRILALAIVLVSGLSIFISLFSSLKERKYELALMRVMGASAGKLFMLILLEGLILAIIGYALGILLSHGGMEILAGYMKDAYRYTFSGWVFLKEEWYLLAGALGIGFIAALIPAIQASRTDISETLAQA